MIDDRALDDENELWDLPPLDGVEGDDEAGEEDGPDRASDDLPSGPLDDPPLGDEAPLDGGEAANPAAWAGAGDDIVELDLRDSSEAANLSLGDDWLVAFVAEDIVAGDDGAPAASPAQEDVIVDPPSTPAGTDGGEDGPLSTDDLLRDGELPPLDADEDECGSGAGA